MQYRRVSGLLVTGVLLLVGGVHAQQSPGKLDGPLAKRRMEVGRTFEASQRGQINPAPKVAKPRIIPKKEWGGAESSGTMRSHVPMNLTLHHVATTTALKPGDDPKAKLIAIQKYGFNDKKWADLPYHFLIDLDGNIFEGRDVMKVGDTNTKYDPAGHFLVSMIGNFELQAPNDKQLNAIADLMAWGSDYFNIDPATIASHRDHVSGTKCPGKFLYPFVVSGYLEGEVRRRVGQAYGAIGADDEPSTPTAPSKTGF